jgi:hypothetical protein
VVDFLIKWKPIFLTWWLSSSCMRVKFLISWLDLFIGAWGQVCDWEGKVTLEGEHFSSSMPKYFSSRLKSLVDGSISYPLGCVYLYDAAKLCWGNICSERDWFYLHGNDISWLELAISLAGIVCGKWEMNWFIVVENTLVRVFLVFLVFVICCREGPRLFGTVIFVRRSDS